MDDWCISYECISPNMKSSDGRVKEFNSKSILCAIAQSIQSRISINPKICSEELLVIEGNSGFYLCNVKNNYKSLYQHYKVR